VNLLDHFVLQHLRVSMLRGELLDAKPSPGNEEAKVELNLTPRLLKTDSGDKLPAYQISARLNCQGGPGGDEGPKFIAQVGYEAVYQQIDGDPVDVAEFTANHAGLTRQLYPLMQQDMRQLLSRLGLERVHLPFDLAARVQGSDAQTVQVSGALH
jgi:hypothetical protein